MPTVAMLSRRPRSLLPFFIKDLSRNESMLTKVMRDNDVDLSGGGGRIPAYLAYFYSYYVYFTGKRWYERQKVKAYTRIPLISACVPLTTQN